MIQQSFKGLEPDTNETKTQSLNVRAAIIGGAVGGGVLLLLIVVLVMVVCLVKKLRYTVHAV